MVFHCLLKTFLYPYKNNFQIITLWYCWWTPELLLETATQALLFKFQILGNAAILNLCNAPGAWSVLLNHKLQFNISSPGEEALRLSVNTFKNLLFISFFGCV